jgi:integrase
VARKVRDATLDSRAARSRLKAQGKPHYRQIDPGLHLGYRRLAGSAGTWTVRLYKGETARGSPYVTEVIGAADDFSDANGADILTFAQAQTKAREMRDMRSRSAAGILGPFTVDQAMADYLRYLEDKRATADDVDYRYRAFIKDQLGSIEVASLTAKKIRDWHSNLAKQPPRLRTGKGEEQQYRKPAKDAESKRRRQASANRVLTSLKAALNRAWRDGRVPSNTEWARVEPFEDVDAARVRYLNFDEAKRLVNACNPDFRNLVQGALETGARYGELIRLTVADFVIAKQERQNGTLIEVGMINVRRSKSGKPRHVVLSHEGKKFFDTLCAGRAGDALIFTKADGTSWANSNQKRPMDAAVARAKIKPSISFHGLRHTWASLAVMNGIPLLVVARNLGHATTRMVEKHYGHLAPTFITDAILTGAPRFGFKPDTKIAMLRG